VRNVPRTAVLGVSDPSQDCVLGYSQPSLRD
jgi:hypothetical protein